MMDPKILTRGSGGTRRHVLIWMRDQEAVTSLLLFNRVLDNFLLQPAEDLRSNELSLKGFPIYFWFFILTIVGPYLP